MFKWFGLKFYLLWNFETELCKIKLFKELNLNCNFIINKIEWNCILNFESEFEMKLNLIEMKLFKSNCN